MQRNMLTELEFLRYNLMVVLGGFPFREILPHKIYCLGALQLRVHKMISALLRRKCSTGLYCPNIFKSWSSFSGSFWIPMCMLVLEG